MCVTEIYLDISIIRYCHFVCIYAILHECEFKSAECLAKFRNKYIHSWLVGVKQTNTLMIRHVKWGRSRRPSWRIKIDYN